MKQILKQKHENQKTKRVLIFKGTVVVKMWLFICEGRKVGLFTLKWKIKWLQKHLHSAHGIKWAWQGEKEENRNSYNLDIWISEIYENV